MLYYIYLITNILTNSCYIGYTINPTRRWREHKYHRHNHNSYMSRAILYYGEQNFTFEIIECYKSSEEALLSEAYWIDRLKTFNIKLYNISSGGKFFTHSKDTKNKMSLNMIGNKNHMYGMIVSQEVRKKISTSHKIRLLTHKNNSYGRKGENAFRSIFTQVEVDSMRNERKNNKSIKYLAYKYGAHKSTILRILHNKRYKDNNYSFKKRVKTELDFSGIDITQKISIIAKQLNTSEDIVRFRLNDYNLRSIKHKYIYNKCFDKNNEEKLYWLGFLFTRGALNFEKNYITITSKNYKMLEDFQKFTNYYGFKIFRGDKTNIFSIRSHKILKILKSYNFLNKNIIHEDIIQSEYLNHFLRGFIDGRSSSSSKQLILRGQNQVMLQIKNILKSKMDISKEINKNRMTFSKLDLIKLKKYIQ